MSPRFLRAWLLALVALLAFGASAQAADHRYKEEVFKKVKVKRDIQYGVGPAAGYQEAEPLMLDMFRPKGDEVKKRPAVVWVHGGGFAAGDKSEGAVVSLAKDFAQRGYVTVSINYRLLVEDGCGGTGNAISPECYQAAIEATHDGQAAVRFLRTNAKRYGIDKKRIGIGGTSAGAIVSCGVAVLSADPGSSGNPGPSSAAQGFVSISGGLPGGIFVDENTAPGILFASTGDPVVPYSWSPEMRDKMAEFGIPAKVVSFDSNVHVPYEQYRKTITKKSSASLYKNLDVKGAQGA